MDKFAKLSDEERKALIEEAANRRGVEPIIIEKDFWVCWTLKHLYTINEISSDIIFKGGTSLSKAYGLIERFSEDVDLTISKSVPIFKDLDPAGSKYPDKVRSKSRKFVSETILPCLEQELRCFFNKEINYKIEPSYNDKEKLLFHYPKVLDYQEASYIKPQIILEFGARGDIEPSGNKEIKPYIVDEFPELFDIPTCIIPTLAAERTFWEKVTILYAIYYGGQHGLKLNDRMFRHYYDVDIMSRSPIANKAIQNAELLDKVIANKRLYFKKDEASYDTAKIGSLKLFPDESLRKELLADYKKMDEMFMSDEPPDFNVIMTGIANLEKRINS